MAGINELDLARQLLDVPGPSADVVAAGQARLGALITEGTAEQPAIRRRPRTPGRPRLGARWQLAGACAAAMTTAALIAAWPAADRHVTAGHVTTPRGDRGPGRPPALRPGAVQTAVLASVTAARGDVLYIRRDGGHGAALNTREWFWPSDPVPGQQVRMLSIAADGMEAENTFYATARDHYTAGSAGPAVTGTQLTIDPHARTWNIQQGTAIRPQLPQATSPALLRHYIAAHVWIVIRASTLAGQRAIELGTTGPDGLREFLWVNARTHLPMRQVKENWNGPGTTLRYTIEYLPATSANIAKLTPAIPPSYKRIPPS